MYYESGVSMTEIRQLPLLQPEKPEDLNTHTELRFTVPLFQKHLLKEGKSQHTINAFTSDLQLLAEHTGDETPVGSYNTTTLNLFLEWLEYGRGVPCSRKTYARRVTTLKVYFKWLFTINAIAHDPAKAILQRSGPAPLATVLSPGEVHSAILAARVMKRGDDLDTRPEMLFRLILDTGIKKGEAVELKPSDIDRSDPRNPVLTVRHKVRNVWKERRIELDYDWLRVFDNYMAQYAPQERIFTCTARNLEYILGDVGDAAGIPAKISFEMLRWTSAVRDAREEKDEDFIRDKLGLSPISWVETRAKIKRLVEIQTRDEARA
jgi:site-specific recombinase XerD